MDIEKITKDFFANHGEDPDSWTTEKKKKQVTLVRNFYQEKGRPAELHTFYKQLENEWIRWKKEQLL